jgi:REP-associated tyrosine transposase
MDEMLFRNRYRIPSARMQGWDYGGGGAYSVTICTLDRICCFGEISAGNLLPSPLGEIVAEEWVETARIRPYVELDAWAVMPNHFHGILFIQPPRISESSRPLGTIIGQFKGACSRRIWGMGRSEFAWQSRFFDQIIRDEKSLLRLRKYILENPLHWESDQLHPDASPPNVETPR